jgi:hypothetical protein
MFVARSAQGIARIEMAENSKYEANTEKNDGMLNNSLLGGRRAHRLDNIQ